MWLNNVSVLGAWAIDQDRTAKVYLGHLSAAGWRNINAGSDSIFYNMLSQLLAAKAAHWLVNVYEDQGAITQIQMPEPPVPTPAAPGIPTPMNGTTWQINARVRGLGSINQDRNAWMYTRDQSTGQDIGWVRQSTTSESGWVVLNMLASSAMSYHARIDYRSDQQGSDVWGVQLVAHEIYLL